MLIVVLLFCNLITVCVCGYLSELCTEPSGRYIREKRRRRRGTIKFPVFNITIIVTNYCIIIKKKKEKKKKKIKLYIFY